MAFLEQYALANSDNDFRYRVQQAAIKAALDLINDPDTPATVVSYCTSILNNPSGYGNRLVYGVATNPVIKGNASDNDIQFQVNAILPAYAGKQAVKPEVAPEVVP